MTEANALLHASAGERATSPQRTPIAGTQLEREILRAPLEAPRYDRPQIGQVWRFHNDKTVGRWHPHGDARCAITMRIEEPQRVGVLCDNTPWMVRGEMLNFAIDYTTMPMYPLHRLPQTWGGDYLSILQQVQANIEANMGGHGVAINDHIGSDPRKVWVICATGPSLKETGKLVANVDRSKVAVVALNSAVDAVGRENVDYHFGLDRRFRAEWSQGCEDIVGVMHPQVPLDACRHYRTLWHYGHPGSGHACSSIRSYYMDRWYGMAEFEQAANVGPSAMHFAYAMGAKVIIWLGLDSGWTAAGDTHWQAGVNGPVTYDEGAVEMNVINKDGETVYVFHSKREYIQAAMYTFGHAYWLQRDGVRVINSTGWGLFYDRPLAQQPWANMVRPNIHGVDDILPPCEPVEFLEAIETLGVRR